jgi:hypothetical protein
MVREGLWYDKFFWDSGSTASVCAVRVAGRE